MKKLLFLFMLLLSSIDMSAQTSFEEDGIKYVVNSESPDYVIVTGYNYSYLGDLVLNGMVNHDGKNYKVQTIMGGDRFSAAFYECEKTIIVNDLPYCTSIGTNAFYRCMGLSSITIPSSVTSIGDNVFYCCFGLSSITIPNSVTSIGDNAFFGCYLLPSSFINNSTLTNSNNWGAIFVDSETEDGLLIKDNAVAKCRPWATSVTIPNSVTSIGASAFWGYSGLTSVTIPNSVTSIGSHAFENCSGLTSVTIPNSVTNIEANAFTGCSGLTTVTIPNSLTSLSKAIFWACSALASITIPNSVTSIGELALADCSNLTSITIPGNVTSIGKNAFGGCSGLTSITVPNSVTSIREGAFSDCIGLTSITIGNSVTSIGRDAFKGCTGLISVTVPNSVTFIGRDAFHGCRSMTSVTIGNSVTSIGMQAFWGCSGLTSVTVGMETPVSIENNVFPTRTGITLNVPVGSKAAYEAAEYWQDFKEIIEMKETVSISSAGMGTFCSTHPLDFSGTDDIKAYIVSAFKPSTGEVTLTRITDVPANTGIVVKGDADTYTIPWGAGETVVANMLVGVTENTVLNKVDGDYTNYILAKKNGNLGFYAVVDGSTLSAGKAYLPLPTAQLPSNAGARQMTMVFDDETTGIQQNISRTELNSDYYDLQGRRVSAPTRGIYIVNGKKVIVK